MYLNKEQKEIISKEIEEFEKRSSAELVAVITQISSSYRFEILVFSLLLSAVVSIISLYFSIDAVKLFEIEVLSFLFFYLLINRFKKIVLLFLPKAYKYEKASFNAKQEFSNLGLRQTETRQAIMFFVSIDEKYVEIITDKEIKEKIDNSFWQNIVKEFIKDVKNRQFTQGYLKAIRACSEVLTKNFPIQKDDKNELSNEVIEL
jgi:putative membrane protein